MKATHRPTARFVIRTPVLPLAAADVAREGLRRRMADPVTREALFVAAPELDIDATDPATERSLYRYLSRMAGRATPFGLFSGVAVGTFAAATRLAGGAEHRRHTRLDNDYLSKLCTALSLDPAIGAGLRYTPNTSLYRGGERYRYAEAHVGAAGRTYSLIALDATDYLEVVLERAARGASIDELVEALTKDPEIAADDARAYLAELIASQVLVSDLQPCVTGTEPAEVIARVLGRTAAGATAAHALEATAAQLAEIDGRPLGSSIDAYRAVARGLEQLPVPIEMPRLFQVDLHVAGVYELGPAVLDALERGAELLAAVAPQREDGWARFRDAFSARYEQREVPLVEALDEESGIGFMSSPEGHAPLLDGLGIGGGSELPRVRWGAREQSLLGLVARAAEQASDEVALTAADLEALRRGTPASLADSFTLDATLIAESAAAVDEGRFRIRLDNFANMSATRLLGRFCHGSPEMTDLVSSLAAGEAQLHPDVIFAEIVHLPEGRVGNILLRPVLRAHEIPFLGSSGVDPAHQIPITDLVLSVVGNRVVLRSRRLGKEVRPRLATAHNHSRGLTIYKFLCELAAQHTDMGMWSWGPLGDAPFLPRIVHDRFVLSRATWTLRSVDLAPLTAAVKAKDAGSRVMTEMRALRERRRLPRWIVLAESDNELVVDLDNPFAVEGFAHLTKNQSAVRIHELLPGPGELCVSGPGGAFTHELLVPFVRTEPPAPRPAIAPRPTRIARRFPPGSSWLYGKLYGGLSSVEVALRELVAPVVRDALAEGHASRWFFIRYNDPDPHIRVRFMGDPARLTAELLPRLSAAAGAAIERGLVWRFQLDTYEREVERYGGDHGMELAEELFAADSTAALRIIELTRGDEGAVGRWKLAVVGLDRLLVDLGLPLGERLALATHARDTFGTEHRMDAAMQKRLGARFRDHRAELEALLRGSSGPDHPLAEGLDAFAARSAASAPAAARLRALASEGKLACSIAEIASSLMHMHVNRLLAASPRAQELVLYDMLRRYYDGVVARTKKS